MQIAEGARLVPVSNSSLALQHSGYPPAAQAIAASDMCLQFTHICSMFHSIYSLYVAASPHFDPAILRFLVCPLTKGDLRWASAFGLHCLLLSRARSSLSSALLLVVLRRYDASKQELISEEINVAYPIIDGIARLVPTAGRVMEAAESPAST